MKAKTVKLGDEYGVAITQGTQGFRLEFRSEDKIEADWMRDMFRKAVRNFKNEVLTKAHVHGSYRQMSSL
jgi:hypothetical protein